MLALVISMVPRRLGLRLVLYGDQENGVMVPLGMLKRNWVG